MLNAYFHRWVLKRRWVTFLVLGISFFAFGVGSLNLFFVFKANATLLSEYGWQAVMDDGLLQLLEIMATGYLCLAAYIVFKACETQLVLGLTRPVSPSEVVPPASATPSNDPDRR